MLASTPRYLHSTALLTKHIMSLQVTTPCDVTKGARNTHLTPTQRVTLRSSLLRRLISLVFLSSTGCTDSPFQLPQDQPIAIDRCHGPWIKQAIQLAQRKEEERKAAFLEMLEI